MNKLEYLAGLGGNDLLDNISKYQCPHKTYCTGHKYPMRCNYIDSRSKCRINRFYNKWGKLATN